MFKGVVAGSFLMTLGAGSQVGTASCWPDKFICWEGFAQQSSQALISKGIVFSQCTQGKLCEHVTLYLWVFVWLVYNLAVCWLADGNHVRVNALVWCYTNGDKIWAGVQAAHNEQALLSLFAALFLLLRPQSQGVMYHPTPFPTHPIYTKVQTQG